MDIKSFNKEELKNSKYVICQICGSRQYVSNLARHRKSRKHIDSNFINNEIFEIKKVKDKPEGKDMIIIKYASG